MSTYLPLFIGVVLRAAIVVWVAACFMWKRKRLWELCKDIRKITIKDIAGVVGVVVVTIIISTVLWTYSQSVFAHQSEYDNEAQIEQQCEIRNSTLPSKEIMEEREKEQFETKPREKHEEKIDDYDEKMKKEFDNIKSRNK